MAVLITCEVCGNRMRVVDETAASGVQCSLCGHRVEVPGHRPPPPPASEGIDELPEASDWGLYTPVKRPHRWAWLAAAGGTVVVALLVVLLFLTGPPARDRAGSGSGPRPARPQAGKSLASPQGTEAAPAGRPPAVPQTVGEMRGPRVSLPRPEMEPAAAFPVGPLTGEAEQQTLLVVRRMFRDAVGANPPGVRRIDTGAQMAATVDGRRYEAVAVAGFSVSVLGPDRLAAEQWHIKTANAWPLAGGIEMPAGTHILFQDGRPEVVDMAARREQARARNEYIARTVQRVAEAADAGDLPRARRLLDAALEKYPDADQLQGWSDEITRRESIATITAVNRGWLPVDVDLMRDGQRVAGVFLKAGGTDTFDVPMGNYTGIWSGSIASHTIEQIAVKGNETWAFFIVPRPTQPGLPDLETWQRRVTR